MSPLISLCSLIASFLETITWKCCDQRFIYSRLKLYRKTTFCVFYFNFIFIIIIYWCCCCYLKLHVYASHLVESHNFGNISFCMCESNMFWVSMICFTISLLYFWVACKRAYTIHIVQLNYSKLWRIVCVGVNV